MANTGLLTQGMTVEQAQILDQRLRKERDAPFRQAQGSYGGGAMGGLLSASGQAINSAALAGRNIGEFAGDAMTGRTGRGQENEIAARKAQTKAEGVKKFTLDKATKLIEAKAKQYEDTNGTAGFSPEEAQGKLSDITNGVLEPLAFIKNNKLPTKSEQNVGNIFNVARRSYSPKDIKEAQDVLTGAGKFEMANSLQSRLDGLIEREDKLKKLDKATKGSVDYIKDTDLPEEVQNKVTDLVLSGTLTNANVPNFIENEIVKQTTSRNKASAITSIGEMVITAEEKQQYIKLIETGAAPAVVLGKVYKKMNPTEITIGQKANMFLSFTPESIEAYVDSKGKEDLVPLSKKTKFTPTNVTKSMSSNLIALIDEMEEKDEAINDFFNTWGGTLQNDKIKAFSSDIYNIAKRDGLTLSRAVTKFMNTQQSLNSEESSTVPKEISPTTSKTITITQSMLDSNSPSLRKGNFKVGDKVTVPNRGG
jgi:hypothetical protein